MIKLSSLATLAFVCALSAAQAAPVSPTSYDMRNGFSGSFNYWDDTYNGSGNTMANGANLSGGVGDLTDGIIATQNWFPAEQPAGAGPYVGWLNINPVINFFFDQVYDFASATFHFDGDGTGGGVSAPRSVDVNGQVANTPNLGINGPYALTVDLTGVSSDQLTATITRQTGWVFLSEVTFETTAATVPVPAGVVLLISGLGGLALMRRRAA